MRPEGRGGRTPYGNGMQPTLTWVDLTASDRDKMRRVLDLFNEQGTLDEMGLGSLRDTVSDALFPGTSYIQTRLRYVLFVPWIYQRLEDKRVSSADVERAGRKAEIDLIGPLEKSDDNQGIIGVRARGVPGPAPQHALLERADPVGRLPASAESGLVPRALCVARGPSQR